LPLYGHEYDEETSPIAAGYGWAVKFTKGDFIGREALLKEKEHGPAKKLSALIFSGRGIPRQGAKVFLPSSGKLLGQVTSGTFSPSLGKPIALAYLASQPAEVLVELRGEKIAGALVDKPFYKRVK
jgi:aminomethyltransferase